MTDNQDALRLADVLERPGYGWHSTPTQCAAHIRRLVAENEAMLVGLQNRDDWLEQKSKRLIASTALLRQAWAVIRWQCFGECRTDGVEGLPSPSETDSAIRQHLGEKT